MDILEETKSRTDQFAGIAAAAESALRASVFFPNEFRHKCKPDAGGNVGEYLHFGAGSGAGQDMVGLPAPGNPQFADQIGKEKGPAEQVRRNIGIDPTQSVLIKFEELPDPCK